jgi:hypothetical protein
MPFCFSLALSLFSGGKAAQNKIHDSCRIENSQIELSCEKFAKNEFIPKQQNRKKSYAVRNLLGERDGGTNEGSTKERSRRPRCFISFQIDSIIQLLMKQKKQESKKKKTN